MKHLLTFLSIVLSVTLSIAQSDYFFGYEDGFRYGCQCNDLPPKNVALVNGSYNAGYSDGKVDGVIYYNKKNQNNSTPQNKPVYYEYPKEPSYTPDFKTYKEALSYKQNLLDTRRNDIYNRSNSILTLMNQFVSKYPDKATPAVKDFITTYVKNVNEYLQWDLTIEQNYTSIINWLNEIQVKVISWY